MMAATERSRIVPAATAPASGGREPWRFATASLADAAAKMAAVAGSQPLQATVLFADICGFSAISAALGPQATVRLLNEHFARLVGCIEAEGGGVDKFIGDAVMAVFAGNDAGSASDEGHARRAVRSAIAMMRAIDAWNREPPRSNLVPLRLGIGIHSGSVVAAGIGPSHCQSRTVVGADVNLAFRLERACRLYRAGILISGRTVRRAGRCHRWRPIDSLAFDGCTHPFGIFEVLDYHTEASFPSLGSVLDLYRHGLAAYRRGRPADALRIFDKALLLNPDDGPSQVYRNRCHAELAGGHRPASAQGCANRRCAMQQTGIGDGALLR